MDSIGRFTAYKGTDKIAYVIDDVTGKERITTHLNYDEAFMSAPVKNQPPMATAIQQSGYIPEQEDVCRVKFKLMHSNAKVPERGTVEAAGLDLYADNTVVVKPGAQTIIPTGVAMELPHGYHAQLHVRSSYAAKYQARVEAGIIDSDYRGQIFVILSNNGQQPIPINQGD